MKKLYRYFLPLVVGLTCLTSCSDPNALPDNVIQSPGGLKIRLEWTTGTTPEAAIHEADLDLKLMRGTEIVGRSENVSRFESVRMYKTLSNGEFRIEVQAHKLQKRADFTITVTDADNLSGKVYASYFRAGEKITLEFLKIVKEGERYSISTY